jgi:competence CoiA-like predicted nuclease
MPLKALHKETGQLTYIFEYESREEIDLILKPLQWQGLLVCPNPDCKAELMVRNGAVVTPHFAHKAHHCRTKYDYHPPSHEHERSKVVIGQRVLERFSTFSYAHVEYEVPIPSMKRIADVMLMFKNGYVEAHEIQLASITTEKLRQRTLDYWKEGIDVHWWLGGKADTEANRQYIFSEFGRVDIIYPEFWSNNNLEGENGKQN